MLGHRVPGRLGPLSDGTVIRLVRTEPHVLPDPTLLLGEFLRLRDLVHLVQEAFPPGIHLLDECPQLFLVLFPGVGIDASEMLRSICPGREE